MWDPILGPDSMPDAIIVACAKWLRSIAHKNVYTIMCTGSDMPLYLHTPPWHGCRNASLMTVCWAKYSSFTLWSTVKHSAVCVSGGRRSIRRSFSS